MSPGDFFISAATAAFAFASCSGVADAIAFAISAGESTVGTPGADAALPVGAAFTDAAPGFAAGIGTCFVGPPAVDPGFTASCCVHFAKSAEVGAPAAG